MDQPSQSPSLSRTVIFIVIIITALIFLGLLTTEKNSAAEREIQNSERVLYQASEKVKSLTSARLEMKATYKSPDRIVILTGEGVIKREDSSYMIFNTGDQSAEVLTVNQTSSYLKDPNTGEWNPLPHDDNFRYLGGMSVAYFSIPQLIEAATHIQAEGEEAIDNHSCYHVMFDFDLLEYIKQQADSNTLQLLDENPDSENKISDMEAKYDLWVDKTTLMTRQYLFTMTFNIEGQVVNAELLMKVSGFNEDVFIPSP
jgi:outer membrane lipoprotein-sorting protein